MASCVSAFAGGTAFFLWRRIDKGNRRRVWLLYGWYSGLMMCGSGVDAVTWTARMMQLANAFKANDAGRKGNIVESYLLSALALSWRAAFSVTYAIGFLLLSAARLMVLDRMSDFVAPRGEGRKRWVVGGKIVFYIAVLGNVVGLAANVAAAVHFQKASEASSAVSTSFAANNTNDGRSHATSFEVSRTDSAWYFNHGSAVIL